MALYLWIIYLLALCLDYSQSQGLQINPNPRVLRKDVRYGRPVLAMANSPSCTFNGIAVEDGKNVASPEPCLNCTCNKGILLCYLRTCNTVVAPPGCRTVRKTGECCPTLDCPDSISLNHYQTERTVEPFHKFRLRNEGGDIFGLPSFDSRTERLTTTSASKPVSMKLTSQESSPTFTAFLKGISKNRRVDPEEQSQYIQEEHSDFDSPMNRNNSSNSDCLVKGYRYTEGTAVLSPTKCEYCYCIRGQQMCVRPKCHLHIDGCIAQYQSGYTCCPSHYMCDTSLADLFDEKKGHHPSDTNSQSQTSNKLTSCNVDGYDFDVGVAVPSRGHCQTCYCTQLGVVCRRLECSPTVPGCTPIVPDGHCCPTQYKCDHNNGDEIPVSHSTDDYDVTVHSSTVTKDEGTSGTEAFEDYTKTHETVQSEKSTSDDSAEKSTDKQKITVELSDESSIESISVIPEENIAVLVLSTDKEEDRSGMESKISSETPSESNAMTFKTGIPPNLVFKKKNKPIRTTTSFNSEESTRPLEKTTTKQDTTTVADNDYKDQDGDYTYDYYNPHDTVTQDAYDTTQHIADMSETAFGETETIEKLQDSTQYFDTKNKLTFKNRNPQLKNQPTSTSHHPLNTEELHDVRYTDKTSKYDVSKPLTITEVDRYTKPNKYTVFSTNSDKTTKIPENQKRFPELKQKHRPHPSFTQTYKTEQDFTRPITTELNLKNRPTIPDEIITTKHSHHSFSGHKNIQATRPTIKTSQSNHKVSSHRRHRPGNPHFTTTVSKPSYTIPDDLAEILRTLSQSQKSSSTEITDSPKFSLHENSTTDYTQKEDTQPPIAPAAPKLIHATDGSNDVSTTTGQTLPPTNPVSAILNFNAPEIIFSNHGPLTNRKQPTYIYEPELPVLINNHKKTSIRFRPPIRSRPQTTPTLEDSFVEISNHRPTNTYRRPPGKFPTLPVPSGKMPNQQSPAGKFPNQPSPAGKFPNQPSPPGKFPNQPIPPGKFQSYPIPADNFPPYPVPVRNRQEEGFYRDPHVKNPNYKSHHPIAGEGYEWSNDYEDYLYEENQENQKQKKVFNNYNTKQDTEGSAFQTDPMNPVTQKTPITTEETVLPIIITSTIREVTTTISPVTEETKPAESAQKNEKTESIQEISTLQEKYKTETTKRIEYTTTPRPKSTYYLPPLTTTPPEFYTTKSFSGYVTNKHRLTEKPRTDFEAKLFRAEDDHKILGSGYIDNRFSDYGSKSHQRFEEEKIKTSTLPPMKSSEPPQNEEDSKEISDVCFVDGRYYNSGEIIVKSNPCEMCKCFYGHPLCQVQQCPAPPGPSCVLEYLPGYCCPRVTCGLETDPEEPPITASPPEPTSQEIKPTIDESDDKWKPLPHGPVVRPYDGTLRTELSINGNKYVHKNSDSHVEIITKPQIYENFFTDNKIKVTDAPTPETTTSSTTTPVSTTTPASTTTTARTTTTTSTTTTSTTTPSTSTSTPIISMTIAQTTTELDTTTLPPETTTIFETTTTITTTSQPTTVTEETTPPTTTPIPTTTESQTTEITTTESAAEEENNIFDSVSTDDSNELPRNKSSEIHDNSSGVRKVLDNLIALPPFKVELSPINDTDISTVLPVIPAHPTTISPTEESVGDLVTLDGMDIGSLPTELSGNLKVSGCNVYGKYYKINDKVAALNEPCSECICSADGISCNAIC